MKGFFNLINVSLQYSLLPLAAMGKSRLFEFFLHLNPDLKRHRFEDTGAPRVPKAVLVAEPID